MSQEIKRYDAVHLRYEDNNIRYGEGCEVEVVVATDHDRAVAELREENDRIRAANLDCVDHYNQMRACLDQAQADRDKLKSVLMRACANKISAAWNDACSEAQLDDYLSTGIAQIQAERDAALALLRECRVRVALPDWARHRIDVLLARQAQTNCTHLPVSTMDGLTYCELCEEKL